MEVSKTWNQSLTNNRGDDLLIIHCQAQYTFKDETGVSRKLANNRDREICLLELKLPIET